MGPLLAGALAGCAAAVLLPSSASAIILSSQITSPAGPVAFPLSTTGATLLVTGTTPTIAPEVKIECDYEGVTSQVLAEKVPVSGGKFSAEVSIEKLQPGLCALHAFQMGSFERYAPGVESEFKGPELAVSAWWPGPQTFLAAAASPDGSTTYVQDAGTYSFEASLYSLAAHLPVHGSFGEADLTSFGYEGSTRSQLQADGVNAYTADGVSMVELKTSQSSMAGRPTPSSAYTLDPATHLMAVNEEEPLVRCRPEDTYPPTKTSCTSFSPLGVSLVRTWQSSNGNRLARETETYRSTDGAAHSVDARNLEEMPVFEGAAWRFPGEAAFGATVAGQSRTLPAGPGTILYRTHAAVSDAGDSVHPQTAIAYETAPSGPVHIVSPTTEPTADIIEIPYVLAVPAGGSSKVLRTAYSDSFSLTEAQSLAEGALAAYHPSVAITSPAAGTSVGTPSVTVAGTASDGVALSSLKVDGTSAAVGATGVWSASVPLTPGTNTITAVAQNQAGLTASASVAVTYVPTPGTAAIVGSPSGRNARVSVTLSCAGGAGQSCRVGLDASTLERLSGRRIAALSARARARSRRVSVASGTVALNPGQTVTVAFGLNRTGRTLLARFKSLPVTLTIQQGGSAKVTRRLTIRPAARRKKH